MHIRLLAYVKALHEDDEDLGEIYEECQRYPKGDFLLHDGYLFKGTRLCVLKCGTNKLLIREAHGGSLTGNYGEKKTLLVLQLCFY